MAGMLLNLLNRRQKNPRHENLLRVPPAAAPQSFRQDLAAAAIIGDELPYIREWAAFHHVVGFDALHLYVNRLDCFERTRKELQDFIEAGFVTLTGWPDFLDFGDRRPILIQNYANAHALAMVRGTTRWLAFIDADEFLFSPVHDWLPDALKPFEELPAVAVYWKNFGSSGRISKPDGLVIESYTDAAVDDCVFNRQFKSIVQPHRVVGVFNAHRFLTDHPDAVAHDENRNPIGNWSYKQNAHTSRILRINHYYVKSAAEFEERIATGWGAKHDKVPIKKRRNRDLIEARTAGDHSILKFAERTRAVMAEGPSARGSRETDPRYASSTPAASL